MASDERIRSFKSFPQVLAILQGGAFTDRLTQLHKEVVQQVDETGKAGKLTITIDYAKAGGTMQLVAKATNKVPEQKPDADTLWPTVEGNLSLDNPHQRNLDLQEVRQKKAMAD